MNIDDQLKKDRLRIVDDNRERIDPATIRMASPSPPKDRDLTFYFPYKTMLYVIVLSLVLSFIIFFFVL